MDLAWFEGSTLYLAEVKSLTPASEVRQLRLGLGHVLHYRSLFRASAPEVRAVVAVEHEPTDPEWVTLCGEHGVDLVWPGTFDPLLSQLTQGCHTFALLTICLGMEAMTRAAEHDLVGSVAPAAAGDDIAFGRIVAAYHDDMSRVCGFVMRDDTLGEDAAQAAWSIVWRKLGSLREPERLRSWLMRIAVNEAKKLMNDRKRRALVEGRADPSRVVGGVDPSTGIDSIDALAAVDRLGPDDRALLVMRYVLGFDATELAAATGKSPAATRQRLKRLLDRLRQELD